MSDILSGGASERRRAIAIKRRVLLAAAIASTAALPGASRGEDAVSRSPIFGVTIPPGYRQWELIATSHEAEPLNELRAILGNPVALEAFRNDSLPFPDGTIIAKVAWKHVPSPVFATASVPGAATTVQIMVKDSKRYPTTGGWGFGRFIGGVAVDEAQHQTCFGCHQALVRDHDDVFTHLAP